MPSENRRKTLIGESIDPAVFDAQFAPDNEARPGWHPSGTLSVLESGSVIIESEATYHAGEVRFVKADFAYGVEVGGPDGCTFFFMSLGPHGRFDPDDHPAPVRSWDETQPTP